MTKQRKARQGKLRARARGPSPRVRETDSLPLATPPLSVFIPGVTPVPAPGVRPTPAPPLPPGVLRFEPKPVQAAYHPENCPGCLAPGFVQTHGWPLPCKCLALTDRGPVVTLANGQQHRYLCPWWDHYPDAPAPF